MAQLMLINPAKRPSKRRRKATPAQLRALAKARRARSGLRSNPSPRRRGLRAVSAPSRRRRARRNPIGMSGIMGDVMNAAIGAGGAVAVNAVFNLLPVTMTGTLSPTMREASKMALAVGLGMVAKPMLGRNAGKMAEGAMTVAAFNLLQSFVPASMGGAVAGLGYMSPGVNAGGYFPSNDSMSGMGEYVSGPGVNAGMGEYVSSGYGY